MQKEGSEYRVLNGVTDEFGNLINWLVALHIEQHVLEGFFDVAHLLVPNGHSVPNYLLLVLMQFDQSSSNCLLLWWVDLEVVVLACGRVYSSVGQSPHALFLRLFEETHKGWSDLQ